MNKKAHLMKTLDTKLIVHKMLRYICCIGTEVDIQLPLNRFQNSSDSSLFSSLLASRRASGH